MKQLFQNYPDTMALIKVIVVSSLFGAFIVFAPSKIVLPVVSILVVVLLVGLIVWSFKQERHMYDRDKPKINY